MCTLLVATVFVIFLDAEKERYRAEVPTPDNKLFNPVIKVVQTQWNNEAKYKSKNTGQSDTGGTQESLNTVITKRIWQRQGTEQGLNTQITGLQRRRGSDVPPIMTPDSVV